MGHEHAHGEHGHDHTAGSGRRVAFVLALAAGYMVAEAVGGWLTNSLALLADAGHMLSDVAALALTLFALWFARRPPTPRRSYGYYRAEILAALANAAALIAISVLIFVEAARRFRHPAEVQGAGVLGIAAGGLAVNLIGLWVLSPGRGANLNIRGAWLHVLTDALGSVGAMASGAAIWAFGWWWTDPLMSVLIGVLVVYSSWRLLAESVGVLMEGTPRGINPDRVRDRIMAVPGVIAVHDLHIWTITSGRNSLSAHVVSDGTRPYEEVLRAVRDAAREACSIDHVTIQVEPPRLDEPSIHP